LVRDLPERLQGQLPILRRKRRFKAPPMMLMEEFAHHPMLREPEAAGFGVLAFLSLYRDDFPWLYDLGLELYRTLQRGDEKEIEQAHRSLKIALEILSRESFMIEFMNSPDDEEGYMFLRRFSHDLEHIIRRTIRHKLGRKVTENDKTNAS
jgi:hypothetical protein